MATRARATFFTTLTFGTIAFCRVAYDVESAQRKIILAGLPDFLARPLATGN